RQCLHRLLRFPLAGFPLLAGHWGSPAWFATVYRILRDDIPARHQELALMDLAVASDLAAYEFLQLRILKWVAAGPAQLQKALRRLQDHRLMFALAAQPQRMPDDLSVELYRRLRPL